MEKQHKAKLITTEKDYFRINPLFRKRVSYIPIKVKLEDKDFKDTIKKFI